MKPRVNRKRLEKEIDMLKLRIKQTEYELNEYKKVYDEETKSRICDLRADWVIGTLDLSRHTEIHRPMRTLTEIEAVMVAEKVKEKINNQGFLCAVSYHIDDESIIIDVRILPPLVIEKTIKED